MSLITEDGTGLSTAESYLSVADALTYHAARGNNTWATITTTQQEQALRRATDYMLQVFRARWKGYRKTGTQALDWPRSFVYLEPFVHGIVGTYPFLVPDSIVPVEVETACAELALKAAAGELLPDLSQGVVKEEIGPIKVEYDRYSTRNPVYTAINSILAPYLSGGGANVSLVRA